MLTIRRHAGGLRISARALVCEEFENRLCLSGLEFVSHDIVLRQLNKPVSTLAADLDGDGDADVISASEGDNRIAWFKNVDGKGSFGLSKTISTQAIGARWVHAADLDQDGDLDVLSASSGDKKIAWYENTDGLGGFGHQRVVALTEGSVRYVGSADLNGDGHVDVFSASWNGRVTWFENLGDVEGFGPSFGPPQVITDAAAKAIAAHAADLDGDGDMDLISAADGAAKITWHENTDGRGDFGKHHVIAARGGAGRSVYAADLDGDGDVDVLAAAVRPTMSTIAWYENLDSRGSFGEQRIITTNVSGARSVYSADMDGDGDNDALSASHADNKIAWYENSDGEGTFGPQQIISQSAANARSVFAMDMDGDQDADVLSAAQWGEKLFWYENEGGRINARHGITEFARFAKSVHAADIDGDGDADVLSASSGDFKIAWYENIDGAGDFGLQRIISTAARHPFSVFAADLDADGDVDVLSASAGDGTIAWYENTDGVGTFGPMKEITRAAGIAQSVYAADVDSDGDMDVLSASDGSPQVAWYENMDGRGTFHWGRVVNGEHGRSHSVYAADIDGDDDVDLLSASFVDGRHEILWYENSDGEGSFYESRSLASGDSRFHSVYAADLDLDGDLDVISASAGQMQVAWYENTDGRGSFGAAQVITRQETESRSVHAADLDHDGDLDVLSASWADGKIVWYENIDAQGSFGPQQVISATASRARSVYAADVDGDGDTDVLSASGGDDKIAWHENLSIQAAAGDANLDFQFNQQDIVLILQAGKFLTGQLANFREGDWNADNVFDQHDLIVALQTRQYLQGPYA